MPFQLQGAPGGQRPPQDLSPPKLSRGGCAQVELHSLDPLGVQARPSGHRPPQSSSPKQAGAHSQAALVCEPRSMQVAGGMSGAQYVLSGQTAKDNDDPILASVVEGGEAPLQLCTLA